MKNKIYKAKVSVQFRKTLKGKYLLLNVLEDKVYEINEVGFEVWNRLAGEKSIKTIVNELQECFKVEHDKIEKDVNSFIKLLIEYNLLEYVGEQKENGH